jgi:hypothetical protein
LSDAHPSVITADVNSGLPPAPRLPENRINPLDLESPFPPAEVLDEPSRTALTVTHECPASRSKRMWARSRTSCSADRR